MEYITGTVIFEEIAWFLIIMHFLDEALSSISPDK